MGRVKEFAVWLAECVYVDEMSDEEILLACHQDTKANRHADRQQWLVEQIKTVRSHPETYQDMTT